MEPPNRPVAPNSGDVSYDFQTRNIIGIPKAGFPKALVPDDPPNALVVPVPPAPVAPVFVPPEPKIFPEGGVLPVCPNTPEPDPKVPKPPFRGCDIEVSEWKLRN